MGDLNWSKPYPVFFLFEISQQIRSLDQTLCLDLVFCRFCSRPFTLTCGHESIHLCNNAVQARYTNAERSSKLPSDNMWDNKTFIQFLKDNGVGDKWHSLIYPTMKKCLISKLVNIAALYKL